MPSPDLERAIKPVYDLYVKRQKQQGFLLWASFGECLEFTETLILFGKAIKKLEKKK